MNRMYWNQRNREVIFYETVLRNHPDYAGSPIWYDHNSEWHIEGGDILNINAKTLAIGISERTQTAAIDELAKNMFWGSDEAEIENIYAIKIPHGYATCTSTPSARRSIAISSRSIPASTRRFVPTA